jgi:hypothetical protein
MHSTRCRRNDLAEATNEPEPRRYPRHGRSASRTRNSDRRVRAPTLEPAARRRTFPHVSGPCTSDLTVARFQLGNSFSRTPQAKNLVTHGVYSRIQNPICLFGTFVFVGLFLFLERPWLLLLIVPVLILETIRARAESRVLEEHFGEEYRRYTASTWF